jgi:hypothetical protein
MAAPFTKAIGRVVALFEATFAEAVILRREERSSLALIEMQGTYGVYRVHLREIRQADGARKYAYYVLYQSDVLLALTTPLTQGHYVSSMIRTMYVIAWN